MFWTEKVGLVEEDLVRANNQIINIFAPKLNR